MLANRIEISDERFERHCRVEVNAYWITVYDMEGNILFQREPQMKEWLDEKHNNFIDAICAFERATIDAAL